MPGRAPFAKMNGVGNEIIVADMRGRADRVSAEAAIALNADPATRFDQIMAIHDARTPGTDNYIAILNSDGTPALSKVAEEAGIPLIYVNVQPTDLSTLGKQQAFVGSNETESGTLQTKEVCRMLGGKGNVVIMIGDLTSQAARQRTQDVHDVVNTPDCGGLKVVQEQVGNWSRVNGADLVSNWLTSGVEFDAIIANNDEMALGAISALKAAGASTDKIIVSGIDATPEALQAMKTGDLKVTVFQDAKGQGKGSIDAAMKAIKGEKLDREVWIPFQLVTQKNMADFEHLN